MNRTYLVVFERGAEGWSSFAPDIAGTGGLGDTVDEARQSLLEGIGYVLEHNAEHNLPLPEATTTSVDFSQFDPHPEQSHYEIEWLTVETPRLSTNTTDRVQQAA